MIKVLDASAIILFFEAKKGCEEIKELFLKALDGRQTLLTTTVNWGEVRYILIRKYGLSQAQEVLQVFETLPIDVVDVTKEVASCASDFKVKYKIGYLDAILAALAKVNKAQCVTSDVGFKVLQKELDINLITI